MPVPRRSSPSGESATSSHTYRARRSLTPAQLLEQLRHAVLGPARRRDPGAAAERGDLDPGVLAERPGVRRADAAAELAPSRARSRSSSRPSSGGNGSEARAARAPSPAAPRAAPRACARSRRRGGRSQGRHCTCSTSVELVDLLRHARRLGAARGAAGRRRPSGRPRTRRGRPAAPSSSIRSSTRVASPSGASRIASSASSGRTRETQPRRDELERAERDEHERGGADGDRVVARAGGHPDRGDDPERRRGRQAANGDPADDDRAGAEEADPGHDLRRDPRRVEDDARGGRERPVRPGVGGDEREDAGAERDDQVRPEARLVVAQLALEPDRAAEPRRDQQAEERLGGRQLRQRAPRRSPRSARP